MRRCLETANRCPSPTPADQRAYTGWPIGVTYQEACRRMGPLYYIWPIGEETLRAQSLDHIDVSPVVRVIDKTPEMYAVTARQIPQDIP